MQQPAPPNTPRRGVAGLYTIILIKFGKGCLLLAVALGILSLTGHNLDKDFDQFLRWVRLDPEQAFFAELGKRLEAITPANLRWVASGTLIYSIMLFVESGGLMARAWWAGWLAIGETAFFIPIEVYKLVEHLTTAVICLLVVNIFIVWYLVKNRGRLFQNH